MIFARCTALPAVADDETEFATNTRKLNPCTRSLAVRHDVVQCLLCDSIEAQRFGGTDPVWQLSMARKGDLDSRLLS